MNLNSDNNAILRAKMVETQIAPRGINDARVLSAMRKVARHRFIPEIPTELAYSDSALGIEQGQTISQPFIVAQMSQLLRLNGTEKVMEIGTGSGYQAAILCELATWVYSIERLPALAHTAQEHLEAEGYRNFSIRVGDGTLGWMEHAPFDAILVAAAAPDVPTELLGQLVIGGRLVIPVGERYRQRLQLWQRSEDGFIHNNDIPVIFVPLIGEQGWQNDKGEI